jgi:prepilin-type N-terminal cleavage/methylation domain-containing protein
MSARFIFRWRLRPPTRAFTLVELLVSIALLSFLLLILASVTDSATRAWRDSQNHTDTLQSARTSLEILARELGPAVVDTRMQFVVAPGDILTKVGAQHVAPESPVLLWMAPLGEQGGLRCTGYYLYRDEARKFYRLKRLFIEPTGKTAPFFPRMINTANPRDPELRTSAVDAVWFTRQWNAQTFDEEDPSNDKVAVSAAADGVIAFWAQCLDALGNPIPLLAQDTIHPKSALHYNSAAYFQAATTTKFENGRSLLYLAQTPQTMKANRVPAAIDLTVVIVDHTILTRGLSVPSQINKLDSTGALDVEASVKDFQTRLQQNRIYSARTFTTRAKLVNGS